MYAAYFVRKEILLHSFPGKQRSTTSRCGMCAQLEFQFRPVTRRDNREMCLLVFYTGNFSDQSLFGTVYPLVQLVLGWLGVCCKRNSECV